MHMDISGLGASTAGFDAGIVIFLLILAFGIFIMFLLEYIFQSLAFYNFMKNRNLDNAFLAWIPIVRLYTFGKVYDDINEKEGKTTNFGIILLILNCVYWALYLLSISIDRPTLISVLIWGLSFALLTLQLICFNLIFRKYVPNNSSYFVLTVIFSTIPIIPFIPGLCLLKASKNEPVSGSRE